MKHIGSLLLTLTLSPIFSLAQNSQEAASTLAANTSIPVELSKSVDARKSKAGDKIEATVTMDLLSQGRVVLPRNSKIFGHVTTAIARSKQSVVSVLGIAFDCVQLKGGRRLSLRVMLQAVAAPVNPFVARRDMADVGGLADVLSVATIGRGVEVVPNYIPAFAQSPGRLVDLLNSSRPRPGSLPTGALDSQSQGIFGLKDMIVGAAPSQNLFSSRTRNIHLDAGTQLVLRTQ